MKWRNFTKWLYQIDNRNYLTSDSKSNPKCKYFSLNIFSVLIHFYREKNFHLEFLGNSSGLKYVMLYDIKCMESTGPEIEAVFWCQLKSTLSMALPTRICKFTKCFIRTFDLFIDTSVYHWNDLRVACVRQNYWCCIRNHEIKDIWNIEYAHSNCFLIIIYN